MAFKEIGRAVPLTGGEAPSLARRPWFAVAGAAGAGAVLIATALIPYDRIQSRPDRSYDAVEQMQTDTHVSTADDVVSAYHLSGNVKPYLRLDGDQIYFEPHEAR